MYIQMLIHRRYNYEKTKIKKKTDYFKCQVRMCFSTTRHCLPGRVTCFIMLCGDGFMDFIHRPKSKILKY
jgi:hypothetical protein